MKEFKPHMMYKGDKSVKANSLAAHLRLKKQGYGHKAPSYSKGGKTKDKPVQGGTLPEVTVTAPKYKGAKIKRENNKKFIGGSAPMVGGAKMLGLGKSAFNLAKKIPSLLSRLAPRTAAAAGEAVESAKVLRKLKPKRIRR